MAVFFSTVNAADPLQSPRDTISTGGIGSIATHYVRFGLPVNALPMTSSDYILIDYPNYSEVTAPTSMSGNFGGTPVFSVVGTRVRITGITAVPGTFLTIRGITAFNPPEPDEFDLYISISSDADGNNIRLQTHILATPTNGSITVTANIEAVVGTLRISGFGSPGMFVVFTENDTVIGSCTAENDGSFTQLFSGITPTDHTILVSGVDQFNRATPASVVEVFTQAYMTTNVSGIILPPTFELDKYQISKGDPVIVTGRGTPGYLYKVITEPPVNSFEGLVDVDGNFTVTIDNTDTMDYGDHKVYALVQDNLGTQSLFSNTLFFKIVDSQPSHGDPPCDISRADLNCDSTVNLIDFSILLYNWGMSSAAADINNDGSVNLIDFSVMMFYWQG